MNKKFHIITTLIFTLTWAVIIPQASTMEEVPTVASVIAGQNQAYAKSLFIDRVMKNEDFQKLFEEYKTLNPLECSTEASVLEDKMKKFYREYLANCERESVTPFVPAGTLGFLAAGLPFPGTRLPSPIEEMDRLADTFYLCGPTPKCKFSKMYELIHTVLIPKYQGACSKHFSRIKLGLNDQEEAEVLKVLLSYDEISETIGDPDLLIIALRMMSFHTPITRPYVAVSAWEMDSIWNMYASTFGAFLPGRKPSCFLMGFAKIKDDAFKISFDRWVNHFNMMVQHGPYGGPHMPQNTETEKAKRDFIDNVFRSVNKLLKIGDRQVYTFEKEPIVLQKRLTDWFNILHKITYFELREWEETHHRLDQFTRAVDYASEMLDAEDDHMYSGIAVGPYTVSLVRTNNPEKAEDKAFLKEVVEEQIEQHKKEVERYNILKPFASVLKQTVEWLDDLFDSISKEGRMS